jgi:nucleotide-binding universal stress UspA family protein
MRILAAVDRHPYSALAIAEAAKLAKNTWANVTLLGVDAKSLPRGERSAGNHMGSDMAHHPLIETLRHYREEFLKYFKGGDSPYAGQEFDYEVVEMKKGIWEELRVCRAGKKDLRVRMRLGNPLKEILSESLEKESDLIVLGCDKEKKCVWERAGGVLPGSCPGEPSVSRIDQPDGDLAPGDAGYRRAHGKGKPQGRGREKDGLDSQVLRGPPDQALDQTRR